MTAWTKQEEAALRSIVEKACEPPPPPPITIHLSARPDGAMLAQAVWNGHLYQGAETPDQGALTAIARALVDAKAGDMPWVAERGGVQHNRGPSLHHLAAL